MITILPGPIINFTTGLKGTYILLILIRENLSIIINKKAISLEAGFYLYVGSAYGAGGLASRLHRHIRKKKKRHWHIDQVTMSSKTSVIGIGVSINNNIECLTAQILSGLDQIKPIYSFGNSDCKDTCTSHFFRLD
ncbi:MAG: GIY-YIG nuclease family protein [Candidatus Heimdallarchaeaceae archaeon]